MQVALIGRQPAQVTAVGLELLEPIARGIVAVGATTNG
jgi:hypothetical protein